MQKMRMIRPLRYGGRQYGVGDVADVSVFHARMFRVLRWAEDYVEPVAEPVAETAAEPVVRPKRKYTRRNTAEQSDDARRYKRRDMTAEE